MKLKLKYGDKTIDCVIDNSKISKVLFANEKDGLRDPVKKIEQSLKFPIGSPSLKELVNKKSPEKVVIIVNDVTRETPYRIMLPPLLKELQETGVEKEQIVFVIATGIHDPHTEEQSEQIFGKEILNNYRFIFHDCEKDIVNLGKLSTGNELLINKEVVNADFIITTGVILPHYIAGFSGGRKSILPGVAGRKTIEFNHARMVELMGNLPPVEENPVSLEMMEAAKRVGVDFILNVVTNSKKEIVEVVAGDLQEAWNAGIDISASMYYVSLNEKADVSIVSAGGYPRDINVYQAQKALDHADLGTRSGGTIILLAECREGLGEKVFKDWIFAAEKPEDNIAKIKEKFVLGGHKAFAISKVALNKEIILISSLDRHTTEKLFAKKMASLQDALNYVEKKYDGNYSAIIMPQGSLTVPLIKS